MPFDHAAYAELFNSGDDETLVKRYFTEDAVFSGSSTDLKGHDQILAFLNQAHDGIRETMRPQVVTRSATHIAAEIDMDFHATEDRPGFAFRPLSRGEFTTVKFFVTYELDPTGERIAGLRTATWEADHGVTPAPTRIRPDAAGKRAFQDYLLSFSVANTERFPQFYTDDVELRLPSVGVLRGRETIAAYYDGMFRSVRETLTAHAIVVDEDRLALEATSRFTAIEDAPDFSISPLKRGESVEGDYFIHYTLRDGRIRRIGIARRGPMRGPFIAEPGESAEAVA
ncbi:nuclear transport factor 2 family protein [Streptomyces sp. NPDC047081]|uniref:nuclear transport factor 2 family protein n=1 Tax=Streptomyces sp. NPDC047081 TaxID=3154706 RepID=UPI0033DD8074